MNKMSTKLIMTTTMNGEEHKCWREMNKALIEHNGYYVRKQYYPHSMNVWEKEHHELEQSYRRRINDMMAARINLDAVETHLENEQLAARALLMLKERDERKNLRAAKKVTTPGSNTIRRSTRIANKK
jgi:hypothetical protein